MDDHKTDNPSPVINGEEQGELYSPERATVRLVKDEEKSEEEDIAGQQGDLYSPDKAKKLEADRSVVKEGKTAERDKAGAAKLSSS